MVLEFGFTQETEMKAGKVLRIYIGKMPMDPLTEVSSVRAIALRGLEGDRYASLSGSFSHAPKVRNVTLISEEAFLIAKRDHGIVFAPQEARRNIVVSVSVNDLNSLVGKYFRVGQVTMFGTELCDPCKLPARLIGKPDRDFIDGFKNAGGIRARIDTDGVIDVNACVSLLISLSMLPQCP